MVVGWMDPLPASFSPPPSSSSLLFSGIKVPPSVLVLMSVARRLPLGSIMLVCHCATVLGSVFYSFTQQPTPKHVYTWREGEKEKKKTK